MATKQHLLQGIGNNPEFGKDGHKIDATNASYLSVTDKDGNLLRVKGAQSSASDEFVTQAQLDGVSAEITGEWNAFSYDATGSLTQLDGEGSGTNGAILRGDKYKIYGDGSVLTESVNDGDGLVALVDDAPLSGTNPTPTIGTHWLVIKIKDANDLSDGVTTEAVSGKVTVKDGGISTDKIAADAVTGAKIADDAINSEHVAAGALDTEHYADVSITGAKVASSTIAKTNLVAGVQTTLTNADTQYGTRNTNFESAIGGSFDSDSDNSIAAQTNYATATTITGQLAQIDSRMKLDNDDNAARVATITYNGGSTQNIGSAIKSGRTVTKVSFLPDSNWNGTGAGITVGISGSTSKYVSISDLYEQTVQTVHVLDALSSDTQVFVTLDAGTATAGSVLVVVEHV